MKKLQEITVEYLFLASPHFGDPVTFDKTLF